MKIVIRLATIDDKALAFKLFVSSRNEFSRLGWEPAQVEALLREQFEFQKHGRKSKRPRSTDEVIVADGVDCGYLTVDRSGPEIVLVDLAILPEFQGSGIGSKALEQLLESATQSKQNVVLSVASDNPAQRLYERLGFSVVGENGMYRSMKWPFSVLETRVAA